MNVEEVYSVVVDTAFHLHRDFGPGLLESVYEAVLARMLEECGWNGKCLLPLTSMMLGRIQRIGRRKVERQVSVAFNFNGMHFDERDFASSRLRVSQKVGGTRRRHSP